jgi:hypothetical protein
MGSKFILIIPRFAWSNVFVPRESFILDFVEMADFFHSLRENTCSIDWFTSMSEHALAF